MKYDQIFLDIETGRDEALTDAWIASRVYHAPSNWVDPFKIDNKIEELKAADRVSAALNLHTLRVGVISYAFDEGPVKTIANHGVGEKAMLGVFRETLNNCQTIITFKGSSFDLPALRMRMFHFGIRLPHVLKPGQKPWDTSIQFDLWHALTNGDRQMKGTLVDWCRYAGVPGPIPHDGAKVAKMIDAQDFTFPKEVCESDVDALRNLYNAAVAVGWI